MSLDVGLEPARKATSGWADLPASFKQIGFVLYRGLHVFIFEGIERVEEHEDRAEYFYTPLLLLEHETSEYTYLETEQVHAISFHVIMWDEEVVNAIINYMQTQLKIENVERERLKPIPFKEMRLTRRSSSDEFNCPGEWQSYHLGQSETFRLVCPSKVKVEAFVKTMRTQPRQLENTFAIEFKLPPTLDSAKMQGDVITSKPVNIDLSWETCRHDFNDDPSTRHQEEHSSVDNETAREQGDRKLSLEILAKKLEQLELMVTKSASKASENNKELRKEMGGFKDDVMSLISNAKEETSKADIKIERELERVKKDVNETEKTKDASISEVKESKSNKSTMFRSAIFPGFIAIAAVLAFVAMNMNAKTSVEKLKTETTSDQFDVELGPIAARQTEEQDMAKWRLRFEAETEKRISSLESYLTSALAKNQKVFFSARPSSERYSDGRIDFRQKGLINVGWTIDLEKGVFTVPRDGHYALFFHSLSTAADAGEDDVDDDDDTAVSIVRNDERLVATRMDGEQPFTLSVVQMLNKGDELSVVIEHGGIWLSMPERRNRKYDRPLKPISVFSAFSID